MINSLNIWIENIHCQACASSLKTLLSKYFNFGTGANYTEESQINQTIGFFKLLEFNKWHFPNNIDVLEIDINKELGFVKITFDGPYENDYKATLSFNASLQSAIAKDLERSGFKVKDLFITRDLESDLHDSYHPSKFDTFWNKLWNTKKNQLKTHMKYCSECKKINNAESPKEVTNEDNGNYRAVFSIENMKTEDDINGVKKVIENVLPHVEDVINAIEIQFTKGIVTVVIPNKLQVQKIINSLSEAKYISKLLEIFPMKTEKKYKVTAAIGGITCAACGSSITNSIKDLPFLIDSAINVVTKTGVFILDSNDQKLLELLKDSIEDCGFDFELIGEPTLVNLASTKKQTRTVVLRVDGMFCEQCPTRIATSLEKFGNLDLVINNTISLQNPFIKFTYIPNVDANVTIRDIIAEIVRCVSKGNNTNIKVSISEDITIEEHLKSIARQETVKIAVRLFCAFVISIPTFIFSIVGTSLLPKDNSFRLWLQHPILVGHVSRIVWILFFLSTPVYFFIDDLFHRKALLEIRSLWRQKNNWTKRFFRFGSMNLLMSLGTSVAYFASLILLVISARAKSQHKVIGYTTTYFDSVVFLTLFLLIGRLLESFSKSKTAEAINQLSSLKQSSVTLVDKILDNKFSNDRIIDVKYLEMGDYIKIAPGESPPIDSIVVQGESEFDESALTGESIPITHTSGEQIYAGTVNVGTQFIICKISTLDGDSLLDKILNTVRDGQLNRAPVERLADILTGYFVPVITCIAIITWTIWLTLGLSGKLPYTYLDIDVGGWPIWSLEFAISVFVVACPCGIGLAAPTALFVGSGLAAKYGILARGGGAAFQEGSKVSVVCFDKTGTLTKGGSLQVTNYAIHSNPKIRKIAIQLTRDLESNSKHPLAIAVKNFIDSSFSEILGTTKVPGTHEISGCGMKGEVILDPKTSNGIWQELKPQSVIVGNEKLLSENNCHLNSDQLKMLTEWKFQGKSIVITAIKCEVFFKSDKYFPVMVMAMKDELRPEAKHVISLLKKEGITCWMISGDNEVTAQAIAKELDIEHVVANVLPEEKSNKIKWIQQTYDKNGKKSIVAMVGDGINDAPALAAANIGIALASGSDLAMSSCDFVLLSHNNTLLSLLTLFQLSRTVFRRVRFNFGWALIYNIISIPIAAGVIYPYKNSRLSPVWASAAMALSSVSVVLSSLALKLFKPSSIFQDIDGYNKDKKISAIQEKFV